MRLLLDECVPWRLKRELPDHEVRTVAEMGWSSKRNGVLLKLMLEADFEGLITVDQNLVFQQNVSASGIAVVVMVARKNRLKELQPLMPLVRMSSRQSITRKRDSRRRARLDLQEVRTAVESQHGSRSFEGLFQRKNHRSSRS